MLSSLQSENTFQSRYPLAAAVTPYANQSLLLVVQVPVGYGRVHRRDVAKWREQLQVEVFSFQLETSAWQHAATFLPVLFRENLWLQLNRAVRICQGISCWIFVCFVFLRWLCCLSFDSYNNFPSVVFDQRLLLKQQRCRQSKEKLWRGNRACKLNDGLF